MKHFLDKMKTDIKKGWENGITAVMQGVNVVSLKMNELSEEGRRQYKIFQLHVKMKDQLQVLGQLTYSALNQMKSLDENKKIKSAYAKIKKLEWQLGQLSRGKRIKVAASKASRKSKVQSPSE